MVLFWYIKLPISKFSEKSRDTIEKLEDILMCQETIYTDATNVNVDKKQGYIRNFSSADTAVYHAMGSKSVKSLEKTGLLNKYTGTLVHDHETALYHFGTGHGECNVHLLRYLRKNTEETGNTWSGDMSIYCFLAHKDVFKLFYGIPGFFRKFPAEIIYTSF